MPQVKNRLFYGVSGCWWSDGQDRMVKLAPLPVHSMRKGLLAFEEDDAQGFGAYVGTYHRA